MAPDLELPEEMEVDDKTLRFPYADTLPLPPEEKLESLREDIKENGIISAIVVAETEENGVYDVLDGNTRLRIVHDLGWDDDRRAGIPVSVREDLSEGDKFLAVLRYNEARRDSVAKSKTTRRKWVKEIKDKDGRIGYRKIAKALGVSHMTVKRDLDKLKAEESEEYHEAHKQRKRVERRRDYISSVEGWIKEDDVDTGLSDDELETFKAHLGQVKEKWNEQLSELRAKERDLSPDDEDEEEEQAAE